MPGVWARNEQAAILARPTVVIAWPPFLVSTFSCKAIPLAGSVLISVPRAVASVPEDSSSLRERSLLLAVPKLGHHQTSYSPLMLDRNHAEIDSPAGRLIRPALKPVSNAPSVEPLPRIGLKGYLRLARVMTAFSLFM